MRDILDWFAALGPELKPPALAGGVLILTLALDILQRRLMARLKVRAARTANLWDDALLHAFTGPLSVLLWFTGLLGVLALARRAYRWDWLGQASSAWSLLLIAALAWFLLRLVRGFEQALVQDHLRRGEAVDRSTIDAIGKLVRVVVVVLAALAALQTLGVGIAGILAAGGVGGIAVGFAAKDLLANFFGGLTVYLDRPFVIGDWIRTLDGQIEGVVERIGWRSTVVRTFDKRPIYVPNALFTTIAVENPSRMTHRRIQEWVGVRYDDAARIGAVVAGIRAALEDYAEIDRGEDLLVTVDRLNPASIDLLVECHTRRRWAAEFRPVRHEVLLRVHAAIRAAGAEIAVPTQLLRVQGYPPERGP